jgi:hypothetical protein
VSRVPVLLTAGPPSGAPPGWVALRPTACPCCVGRVALQLELARLIRDEHPRGVVIELADPAHLPGMRRALGEWPLSEKVELAVRSPE